MIASRRERNFAPEGLTVVLHTGEAPVAIEGRPTGASIPAPGWPELELPIYTFDGWSSGLYPTVDLAAFTTAFDRALANTGSTLIVAVHADVPDWDLDDACAWRYDWQAREFTTVPIAEATALFHEDTNVLAYPCDRAPYASVTALDPDRVQGEDLSAADGRTAT
ncbi:MULTISPECIES: hypothetical protein [unclassified Streptomyces]|uniref:hypothetical protein n=1 Tax=unclassified Streptomyces TaxID=2593676 RepID=UPI00093A03FF|nr:hypothetical protein [Streptomyces sp. TSRI0107]